MKLKNPFKPTTAEEDFTVNKLPHNRREVFFDVIRLHWKNFIGYGLIILLFSLPCLISAIAEDIITIKLMEGYDALSAQEQGNILAQICSVKNARAALDIISYAVLAVGVAGIVRVVRQHAWGESVFFAADFAKGIKQNSWQMIFIGVLFGIINLLCVSTYSMLALMPERTMAFIAVLSIDILIIAAIPTFAYAIVSIAVYEKKLLGHLLTALALIAKAPFKTMLAIICCLVPFSLQFVPITYCHFFGRAVSSVLVPLIMFGWMLFAFNILDGLINKTKYPELVGRGTFPLENNEIDNAANGIDNE